MSYQKQNFANGEVLTAPQLNHIEDGIVDLEINSSTSFASKADKSEVQANAKKISDESTRAQAAESAINETISTIIDHTLSLSGKAADAKATGDAVQSVMDDLASEVSRAETVEKANADNIATEVERAQAAESALSTKITEEATRAEQAEQALDTRTAALESCGFVVVDGKVCMKYVKS